MSEQRLHDLFEERVDGLESVDLSSTAWQRAKEVRRRRRTLAGVTLVVTVVIGATGIFASQTQDGAMPAPATSSTASSATPTAATPPSSGPVPAAVPVGRQHGAEIWWAPTKQEEADLPLLAVGGIPEEIDLSGAARQGIPGLPVTAAFTVGDDGDLDPDASRLLLLAGDGEIYDLDTGRLDPVADEGGNAYPPLGEQSLSPDGRHLFLRQTTSLRVVDLLDGGEWTTIETPPWLAEGARWLGPGEIWVPEVLGDEDGPGTVYDVEGNRLRTDWRTQYALWEAAGSQPYGPQALDPVGIHLSGLGPATAQAQFPDVELVDPDGATVSGTDAVVTRDQSFSKLSVLVLPYGPGDGSGRWKACCPVVGWLGGPETVLFVSRGSEWRVLAWDVGSQRLWRVTELDGWVPGEDVVVASWAALRPA